MEAISYTAARQNLAKKMDKVCNDRLPIIENKEGLPILNNNYLFFIFVTFPFNFPSWLISLLKR